MAGAGSKQSLALATAVVVALAATLHPPQLLPALGGWRAAGHKAVLNTYSLHISGPEVALSDGDTLRVTVPLDRLGRLMPVVTADTELGLTHNVVDAPLFLQNWALLSQHVDAELQPAGGRRVFPVPAAAMLAASALKPSQPFTMAELIDAAHAAGAAHELTHVAPPSVLLNVPGQPVAAIADVMGVRPAPGGGGAAAVELTLRVVRNPHMIPETMPHPKQVLHEGGEAAGDGVRHYHLFAAEGVSVDAGAFLDLLERGGAPAELHVFAKGIIASFLFVAKPAGVSAASPGGTVQVNVTAADMTGSALNAPTFFTTVCESPSSGAYNSSTRPAGQSAYTFTLPVVPPGSTAAGLTYPDSGAPQLCLLKLYSTRSDGNAMFIGRQVPVFLGPPGMRMAEPTYCLDTSPNVATAVATTLRCPAGRQIKVSGATAFAGIVLCGVRGKVPTFESFTPQSSCTMDYSAQVQVGCDGRRQCTVNATALGGLEPISSPGCTNGGSDWSGRFVVVAYTCDLAPCPLPPSATNLGYTESCTGCTYDCTTKNLTCAVCQCKCRTSDCSCPSQASLDYSLCRPGSAVGYGPTRRSLFCSKPRGM